MDVGRFLVRTDLREGRSVGGLAAAHDFHCARGKEHPG
jgi:hypothetical protein